MKTTMLALASVLCATGNSFPARQFDRARKFYYQGADGDKRAYEQASELFGDLRKECPNEPKIEAYYGSLRLLAAADTWAVWRKNSLSKEGIRLMDSAVAASPADLDIRFVRAITTYNLPSFFHRKAQSQQDFEYLASRAAAAVKQGQLEPRLAAASLYYHGEFLREELRTDQAVHAWNEAIALAPGSRAAHEATAALARMKQPDR